MATNPKLKEVQKQAMDLLKLPGTFNISDLKADKTMYFESPQNSISHKSPFKTSEISARSTALLNKGQTINYGDSDFDEIMRTSVSADVRNRYRESIGMGRLSILPRNTADVSMQSTNEPQKASDDSFWGPAKVYANSFRTQNLSMMSEDFRPAEEMAEKLRKDEIEQEQEYAPIPNIEPVAETSSWEEKSRRQPEMSFGAYCQPFLFNSKEVFGEKESKVRDDRVPMVDSERESSVNMCDVEGLQRWLRNVDTPAAKDLLMKKIKYKNNKEDASMLGICDKINSVDIADSNSEKENTTNNQQETPVRDTPEVFPLDDPLQRDENIIPNRGTKRRSSLNANDTPKSTMDKCMRSKSPAILKDNAASNLKPKFNDNFKVPNSFTDSASTSRQRLQASSPSTREYYSALSSNSCEKLSLPNYGLQRKEIHFTSPTSSIRSKMSKSPQEGQLKRTVSQLSTGSEFQDENLPLKIKKTHRKLSFESVKLNKKATRIVTIQNGSSKKLPLRVKIQGSGFTVSPREDFRMTANEARTFEVTFSPSVIGAAKGELTFELMTNSRCALSIPLFAYGGHASLQFEGTQKGPIGPSFITIGQISELNMPMSQTMILTNHGSIPEFASLSFEKTKWSDFSMSRSLQISPLEVHLMPGESASVRIRFKATKDEVRKILNLGKETTIIGEICVVSGDEATRLRLLKNKAIVPEKLLDCLPEKSPFDEQIKNELAGFVENWDSAKLSTILEKTFRTKEIALTINRNLDETQIIAAELSMTEDSTSFMTFCEGNTIVEQDESDDDTMQDEEYLESRFFRIRPAQIYFNRRTDHPEIPKFITIESNCTTDLFAEAVSSRHEAVTAVKSCGVIKPGESVEVKVTPKAFAFQNLHINNVNVSILIDNAKIEIPVRFIN